MKENKTWYIHRTSRKSKCEIYITKFEGDVFKMEYEIICNYVEHYKDKIAYFTREEAIKYRDLLNQFRKGKRYLWVISNDISKVQEDKIKDFKIDMGPEIPSHDVPTKEPTALFLYPTSKTLQEALESSLRLSAVLSYLL